MPNRDRVLVATFALAALAIAVPAEQPWVQQGAEVVGEELIPELGRVAARDLPVAAPWRPGDPIKDIPRRRFVPSGAFGVEPPPVAVDPLLAHQAAFAAAPADVEPGPAFPGQGFTGVNPPDTVGDIGGPYYVQSVNGSGGALVTVYDKQSGALVAGPFAMDGLGTGGSCASGYGDPIVLYDRAADRWLLSEFSSSGNNLCIYVSTSNDPAGTYCRYNVVAPSFPDYPKYGVWTDAYYVTTNESSPAIYALDRANMASCGTARPVQRFTVADLSGFSFQALTPADLDGVDDPPVGSPGLVMRHRDTEAHGPAGLDTVDRLELWEVAIDWDAPGASTLTALPAIDVAEFDSTLCGLSSFYCMAMPGVAQGSSSSLDPLREVVMHRLAYRRLGSDQVLVGNLVTDVGSNQGGVRWFELRGSGSAWSLHQEGTYAPDAVNRWMGAIAMDGVGNLLLGYNASSGSVHPSLRYTGREATDPLGTMSVPEAVLVAGAASNGSNRYGDYAAMSVDSEDDCTFWFTGEYNAASSWSTYVGATKFESCGAPGFTLGAAPAARAICAGDSAEFVHAVGSVSGFSEPVTLTVSGLPAPVSAGFAPNPVPTLPGSSTLILADTAGVAAGDYAATVTGTAAPSGLVRAKEVLLTVYDAAPSSPALVAPADGAIDLPRSPTLEWSAVSQVASYLVEVATDAGFASVVRSQTTSATSWQVAPQLGIDTVYYWRVTPGNACGSTPSATRSLRTANPSILLVDDDNDAPDLIGGYQTLINTVGAVFDLWDTVDAGGEPTLADLLPYRAVVWFAGDRFCGSSSPCAGPQTAAEGVLGQYLGTGRCLLVTAQDYLYDMGASDVPTPFMTGYLGVAGTGSDSDTGDYTRVDGENVYAAFADSELTKPADYSEYADLLAVGNGGLAAFRGDLPAGNTKVGAVSKLGATYFTTYLGFGLEMMTPSRQAEVLGHFLATCNAQVPLFADDFEVGTTVRWSSVVQ